MSRPSLHRRPLSRARPRLPTPYASMSLALPLTITAICTPIEEDAEEWAIHDYEGFEGAEVGEYFSFENIVELADYIRERGELGAHGRI